MPDEESGDDEAFRQLVGQTIGGRYRIDEQLGEGAMGAVFRATQLGLDRLVAVKVLRPRHTDEPMVAKRFDREAMASSKLDHRNCIQVLDVGTTEDRLKYIVMEHLEGLELRTVISGPLELARAVDLTTQILAGLEHAHRRGMVHRDLKPENVFVVNDDDGAEVVKIVDFGLVKLLDDGSGHERLTRVGMVFGTPAYMAPEQAAGGTVDARTDLYAVGILLYEMLAGEPPFQADAPGILLRMQLISEPPPLPESVPEPVRAVVKQLLAKAARDRFESARQARAALEQAVEVKKPVARGGVVFLPAVTDAEPEPEQARPRRDTQKGTASLAEDEAAKTKSKRSGTMLATEGDLLRASGSMSGRSATMLATPDELPSSSSSTASERSDTMLADHVPLTPEPRSDATGKGVFGTQRAIPSEHPAPTRSGGGANRMIVAILVVAVLAIVGLAASGAFGASRPAVHGGDD